MIRKVYSDMILQKIKEQGSGWLLRRGWQYAMLQLSSLVKRPLCGPALGTLMVTYRCNYHCAMCDMPVKAGEFVRKGKREFGTGQFLQIIKDFARLGAPGIGFTGGETLLREDIFELLAATRQHGMIAHLNTNGWLLGDEQARRIIDIGVDSVNISLDGATAATHDRIRRHPGAFDRAVAAVERLVILKRKQGSSVRIKTVAVIDETNIEEVPALIVLSGRIGTDCIEFIPRQPFAAPMQEAGPEPALLAKVDLLVDYLLKRDALSVPLENSPAHIRLFPNSFAGRPSPVRCRAGYNSLAVDCYGNVFPCVPWINWEKSVGSLGDRSLKEFWCSPEYRQKRASIASCRACYLNCQTELNLLFDLKSMWSGSKKH